MLHLYYINEKLIIMSRIYVISQNNWIRYLQFIFIVDFRYFKNINLRTLKLFLLDSFHNLSVEDSGIIEKTICLYYRVLLWWPGSIEQTT